MEKDILSLDRNTLRDLFLDMGMQPFRGDQVFRWIHRMGVTDYSLMTNFSKTDREALGETLPLSVPLKVIETERSSDASVKFLFETEDNLRIESVLIPSGENDSRHFTLCISTQAGCAMGCSFCMTATMGFIRNLKVSEIVFQVISAVNYIGEHKLNRRQPREQWLSNIVYMGMGEPMLNVENVLTSLSILTDSTGLDFSTRRITVSTCGIIKGMKAFADSNPGVNLAVSLNSAISEKRSELMPCNKSNPLNELVSTIKSWPLKPRQRITIEYIMFAGVNDSNADATALVRLCGPLKVKINLIPYNSSDSNPLILNSAPLKSSSPQVIESFAQTLRNRGLSVTVRRSYGQDIKAACGQLATNK